ncbi:CBS domain-containing protein [Prauserella cavernicola]|uniref:CBS domain-containing protein n=1 Tax=Prauserella cavernicola TaxID=2800127 RepID=A0A934QZN3_9PSEU|nr:CBS domain-containing protein [Prauserella cavernicola]MBK1788449.1 CBS domain-containing protein [Prauserella cavernicola]
MYQTTVGAVMTRDPVSVGPDADFRVIVELLMSHDFGAVPVVNAEQVLLGVIAESDLVLKHEELAARDEQPPVLARQRARQRWNRSWVTRAVDFMTTPVLTLDAGDSLGAAAREFGRSGVRRLYVLEDGLLAGVMTRGDLLKAFVRSDDEIRDELRHDVLHEVFGRALAADPGGVDVAVDRGVVTLVGTVRSRSEADLAQRLAEHVLGVVHVRNELTHRVVDDDASGLARR